MSVLGVHYFDWQMLKSIEKFRDYFCVGKLNFSAPGSIEHSFFHRRTSVHRADFTCSYEEVRLIAQLKYMYAMAHTLQLRTYFCKLPT